MKTIKLTDKQFEQLKEYVIDSCESIMERSLDWGDSTYADELMESNQDIFDIHDFLCECKHKRLTLSPNEHIGNWSLEQTEEFNNDTN